MNEAWLPRFFDRQGNEISMAEFGRLKYEEHDYARVAETLVDCGDQQTAWVSTVWLGLDHSLTFDGSDGTPIIFETLIFGPEPWDGHLWRYPTEAAALAGHERTVAWLRHAVKTETAPPPV